MRRMCGDHRCSRHDGMSSKHGLRRGPPAGSRAGWKQYARYYLLCILCEMRHADPKGVYLLRRLVGAAPRLSAAYQERSNMASCAQLHHLHLDPCPAASNTGCLLPARCRIQSPAHIATMLLQTNHMPCCRSSIQPMPNNPSLKTPTRVEMSHKLLLLELEAVAVGAKVRGKKQVWAYQVCRNRPSTGHLLQLGLCYVLNNTCHRCTP